MTTVVLRLPCGINPGDGWTKEVELDEMTGEEEDILADQTRDPGGSGSFQTSASKRITQILSRCTVRIGEKRRTTGDRFTAPSFFEEAWSKAYMTDRGFAMIRLRQLSLGDAYWFSSPCPTCKREIDRIGVRLDELEVRDVDLAVAGKERHSVVLPRSGAVVEWRFLSGTDEETIEAAVRNFKDEYISHILYRRLISVNGKTIKQAGGLNFIKRLGTMDRRYLGDHFDETEGGIDTRVKITCNSCGVEFSKMLQVGNADFFFPSATPSPSSSSSRRSPKLGAGVSETSLLSGSLDDGD